MKDNRFIELINLYIDRQISGEEMHALEAEMQANPRRRAVYRQYCQMHRATTLVYESFRTDDADQPVERVKTEAQVSRFEPEYGRRRKHWTYYATGLAAACVALAFARVGFNNHASNRTSGAIAQTKPLQVISAAPVSVVSSPVAIVSEQPKPMAIRPSNLVAEQDYAAMLAAMRKDDQRAFASGQIQPSRPTSLFEDGVFDSQQSGSSRIFHNKQSSSQQAEFAAFQFQR